MILKKLKNNNTIVFFGTGQTSLEALQSLNEEFNIEFVVTKPPAKNSASKEFKNNVHVWAEENGINVLTPKDKSSLINLVRQANVQSELGIVLDFGMVIPAQVIDVFSKGILNSHFSLLPSYRGANPIRAAILNGDKKSGVTIIRITPGLDDGPILTWAETDIIGKNALRLREQLSTINCTLLAETVKLYISNELELVEQDESEATYTSKTSKEDGLIDTKKSAEAIAREVLAYAGWPKSYISIDGKELIILEAQSSKEVAPQGKLKVKDKKLFLGCNRGSLQIIKIQPKGKTSMNAQSFINGYLK